MQFHCMAHPYRFYFASCQQNDNTFRKNYEHFAEIHCGLFSNDRFQDSSLENADYKIMICF